MTEQTSETPSHIGLLLKYWMPVLLYCSIIFYLSSQSYPGRQFPSFLFDLSDKLLHGIAYGILGILLFRAFHQTTTPRVSISLAIVCSMAFGISDEFHQWFVPHRQADTLDVVADTLGATFFVCAWVFLKKKFA